MAHPFAGLTGGVSDSNNERVNSDSDLDYPGELMEAYALKALRDTGEIWYYDEERGIFVPGAETMLAARIEDDLGMPHKNKKGKLEPSTLTTHQVNEYIDHIRRRTYVNREDFNPSIEWLACNNCMVNLLTGETREFSPEFMCTTRIPVNFDFTFSTSQIACFFRNVFDERQLHTLCPRIAQFLYEIMSDEDVDLFLDFLAYCLWRAYKFGFWMLFNGAGYNGKSVLLTLIERFLGKQNVSGETLDRLLHERFAPGNLYQKMVNVDADVSADVIFNNTGILKKLTGNDVHTGEFKFKNPFKFVNYAKLIFSCNTIPETEDLTDAFFRRILIINFTQQFFGEKDDPNLIDKLTTEEEFSGLLLELLSRLTRVLQQGIRKVTSESMAETYDKYTRGSNPVKYFYEKGLIAAVGHKITKVRMFERYEEFCREHGLAPESDQSFSRKLTDDFRLKYKRYRIDGELTYCWFDVDFKDWKKAELEELSRIEDFSNETMEAMR